MSRLPIWPFLFTLVAGFAGGVGCAAPSPKPLAAGESAAPTSAPPAASSAPTASAPTLPSPCNQLIQELCTGGIGSAICEMVKTQTLTFAGDRCTNMLKHVPEILVDLKKMEAANQPLGADAAARIASGNAPSFGPPGAKVTLVEFSDFQCPYCALAATVVRQVRVKYGTRIHFVFHQYPLPMHENAHGAAEAALAAHAQGKFWELHDQLFAHQDTLTREGLESLAKSTGLNLVPFKKALDDKTYAADVDADIALGDTVAIQGTPTLFINGVRVANPTSYEDTAAKIDEALAASATSP